MSMNFKSFKYESPNKKQLTYDYILEYFDQYVKLFENLKPSDDLETIIKNAYAPQELCEILEELRQVKIEELQSEHDYISIKTSCRWLNPQQPQISLNHFAALGAQIVTRVAMVLGEVIINLKKFLGFKETDKLNNEIITNQLKKVDNFNTDEYKVLRVHMNAEVAKYFHEENIKLPIDSENCIESLLNNKIIINCVELQQIAIDVAKSYNEAVSNGGMQKFIEDITEFFKKRIENKPVDNIETQSIEQNLGNTESEMLVTSGISKSKRKFSFSKKTEDKNRKEPENLELNEKSLVLKNKVSSVNNTKPKISSPDSFKQDKVISILETLLSTSRLDNKFTKIIIKGATWLANRGAKLQNSELQKKLDQLKLTQELEKKKITNSSFSDNKKTNSGKTNKNSEKSKLDKLKKIFKIQDNTKKIQNSENNEDLYRELEKLIKSN